MARLPRFAFRTSAAMAALSLCMVPGVASALPASIAPTAQAAGDLTWTGSGETAQQNRRWRGRRDGGISAGDVLGGLVILGGIVAVASAIDKSNRDKRERTDGEDYRYPERSGDPRYDTRDPRDSRYEDERYGDGRYSNNRPEPDYDAARATDTAVRTCKAEAERSGPVDEIYGVERTGNDWRMRGSYRNGRDFTCTTDGYGRAWIDSAAGDARYQNRGTGGYQSDDYRPEARVGDDGRYDSGRAPN